ncbi:cytoplasmic FMR1-interacting protein 1 homolog [Camelus ferus]|uniref:Cytoplasmic FMR1-interacting protein 1 homolog n=1 Tax=Camelus ferus TaxID=419612 RepID=A0A8B8SRW3_CAMFR|nr:cytoplasmic FMR1-interacting protein 1 homolog [Camelus ferus]
MHFGKQFILFTTLEPGLLGHLQRLAAASWAPSLPGHLPAAGYQGITAIRGELLQVARSLLRCNILQYEGTLMEVMPEVCWLPHTNTGKPGRHGRHPGDLPAPVEGRR